MSQPLDMAALQAHTAPTFKDAWQARLERWYAHPGLYRWSLGNPFTRWLTRRRTRQLFDLMAGFVHSQVLLGCVRLQLFERLAQRPHTLEEIAARARDWGALTETPDMNPQFGLSCYNYHSDGSGVSLVSMFRPQLDTRPRQMAHMDPAC